ncbi:MAG TPA: 3'-5' exonuclease, partial [Propionibacteriaceae bacterium]
EKMVADGLPADQILTSVLQESGYLAELQESTDPQDETRLENLVELVAVAREFVAGAQAGAQAGGLADPAAGAPDLTLDVLDFDPATGQLLELLPDGEAAAAARPAPLAPAPDGTPALEDTTEFDLAAAAAEPDASLGAFLERVALVADSDQIPPAPDSEDNGVVTLMTLHTAKGLEFDTVFLTGLEDGVFPHQRALANAAELEEERRLAYVGITRARKRLYVSRAVVRSAWGAPQHNPPSRFLNEVPDRLVDWRRTESAQTSWRNTSSTGAAHQSWRNSVGFGARAAVREIPSLAAGDRVLHTTFGMGTVVATSGAGDQAKADVDFGSVGVKRLALRHAPLEKM